MKRLFVLAIAALTACSAEVQPPLVASDVRITGPMTQMKAGYMTLTNNTNQAMTITSVSSPQFGRAEIHESVIEDDVARMRPVGALTIAPGEPVHLEPGGKHLMLMQPVGEPEAVTLNLFAEDALLLSVQTELE